jgi:hypothetical protein
VSASCVRRDWKLLEAVILGLLGRAVEGGLGLAAGQQAVQVWVQHSVLEQFASLHAYVNHSCVCRHPGGKCTMLSHVRTRLCCTHTCSAASRLPGAALGCAAQAHVAAAAARCPAVWHAPAQTSVPAERWFLGACLHPRSKGREHRGVLISMRPSTQQQPLLMHDAVACAEP